MSTKRKAPAATGAIGKLRDQHSIVGQDRKRILATRRKAGVEFFAGKGVRTISPVPAQTIPSPHQRAKRGKVGGWSRHSRARFRDLILEADFPPGWPVISGCWTIPGPVVPYPVAVDLWAQFSKAIEKRGVCFVWRLEVQQRGQLHWHTIGAAPDVFDWELQGRHCWFRLLDTLKVPQDQAIPIPRRDRHGYIIDTEYMFGACRSSIPGADRRAVDLQLVGDARGALLRYVADHASKRKQEQVADGAGRHWGVVGRKHLIRRSGDRLHVLEDDRAWYRFMRAFQRLTTPSHPDPRAPFGRCLGHRNRRGSKGAAVWFSKPETVDRLLTWATAGEASGKTYEQVRQEARQ